MTGVGDTTCVSIQPRHGNHKQQVPGGKLITLYIFLTSHLMFSYVYNAWK